MTAFERALPFILRMEGGYANNPADPGGATMHGITQATYDAWLKAHGFPVRPVKTVSDAEVAAIYRERYWAAASCEGHPWPLALVLFDAAVQHGVQRALNLFQPDAEAFIWRRLAFYRRIPKAKPKTLQFLPGWLWRMEQLRAEAGLAAAGKAAA